MLEPHSPSVSIRRQCALLALPRASVYYRPSGVDNDDLDLMRRIDRLYLQFPFFGSRKIARQLSAEGQPVNRKRVQRLMRLIGIHATAPGPNTGKPHPQHTVYPYLLRGLTIDRPNQVFATDITYIPMAHGFLYLVAIMDWHSRKVLSWRLSNTLDTAFCLEAIKEAIERHGAPQVFNTDQGAQFTSTAFTDVLKAHNIRISMDGKGSYRDNIFIERLWRTVKYECVYLHAFDDGRDARRKLADYFDWYNRQRPHQALGYKTPDQIYFNQISLNMAA